MKQLLAAAILGASIITAAVVVSGGNDAAPIVMAQPSTGPMHVVIDNPCPYGPTGHGGTWGMRAACGIDGYDVP
jgi:hypothetical protein